MSDNKIILVTGATGKQGGAAARSLVQQGFKVKALTRHPDSKQASALKDLNIAVVQGDLDDDATLRAQLQNAYGVFSVQTFERGIKREIRQGIDLATLAAASGIKHFVYASVAGADLKTGIPHFESKFQIENFIKDKGLPYTILRPASFYENFLIPQVSSRIIKGKYVTPLNKNTVQAFIAAADIGKITTSVFVNPEKYIGKTITIASEQMDMAQAAKTLSEILGREIKYEKLPGIITRLAMGGDLYKMFKWVNENNFALAEAIDLTRKEFGEMTKLPQWLKENFKTT